MKRMFYLATIIVLSFFMNSAFAGSAFMSMKFDSSDKTGFSEWKKLANEKNDANGWKTENGFLSQTTPNSDDAVSSEKYLLKDDVLDVSKAQFPVQISVDILPDYYGSNACWYGLSIFNSEETCKSKKSFLIALYKDESEGIERLQFFNDTKTPTAYSSNGKITNRSWHRLVLVLDNFRENNTIDLKAKFWDLSGEEPKSWLIEKTVSSKEIDFTLKGISVICGADYGLGANPRVWFDNLEITDGSVKKSDAQPVKDGVKQKSMPVFNEKAKIQEAYISSLYQIYKKDRYKDFLEEYGKFKKEFPAYKPDAKIRFHEMKALRKRRSFDEARSVANDIETKFKGSEYGKMMGGANGKTEEEAALAFKDCITPFYEDKYDEAKINFKKFINDYPNNWRISDAYEKYFKCFYFKGERENFFSETNDFIKTKIDPEKTAELLLLQAAISIRQGLHEEGNSILDKIEKECAVESIPAEIADLRLVSLFRQKKYEETKLKAEETIKQYKEGSLEWAFGKLWLAVVETELSTHNCKTALENINAIFTSKAAEKFPRIKNEAARWGAYFANGASDKIKMEEYAAIISSAKNK